MIIKQRRCDICQKRINTPRKIIPLNFGEDDFFTIKHTAFRRISRYGYEQEKIKRNIDVCYHCMEKITEYIDRSLLKKENEYS